MVRISLLLCLCLGFSNISFCFATPAVENIPRLDGGAAILSKTNILVLGVDEPADYVGRSDTIFVITLDQGANKMTSLSIPRDSWVKIPGFGWDKINHAYAFGGTKLSKETVQNLLGISIDYTAVLNFNAFVAMVDALGGVTLDVEEIYCSSDLKPGLQRLDGGKAIEYVRFRNETGDIGRVARQQKFLEALMREVVNPEFVNLLPKYGKEFTKIAKTDMPKTEIIKIIPAAILAAKPGLHTEWVTGTPLWIQGISYWQPDIEELRAKVARIQDVSVDEKYIQETEEMESEYQQALDALPGVTY